MIRDQADVAHARARHLRIGILANVAVLFPAALIDVQPLSGLEMIIQPAAYNIEIFTEIDVER